MCNIYPNIDTQHIPTYTHSHTRMHTVSTYRRICIILTQTYSHKYIHTHAHTHAHTRTVISIYSHI